MTTLWICVLIAASGYLGYRLALVLTARKWRKALSDHQKPANYEHLTPAKAYEDTHHKCEREGYICPGHAGYNAWFCDDGRGRG